ncbi:MAG: hypothetical protein JRE71_12090 [Deltaproteobacteria bacterium]|nr:hypothetical protein [Deltaproteobacteria bacterium]
MRVIRGFVFAPIVASLMLTACVGDPWRSVNKKNSLAEYRRYVNQYPDSRNRVKAEENIAFLKLEREPTLDGFASFMAQYPKTKLVESLRAELEPKAFARARFAGTPAAYTEFMTLYPDGAFSERALGNIAYVEAGGFSNGARSLREFAKSHPASDYAAEARRSVRALQLKSQELFDRVGLVIRITPSTAEASRVAGAFTDRARRQFESAGQQLVKIPELRTREQNAKIPKARLVIEHKEARAKSKISNGNFTRPGMLATTRVSLYAEEGSEPIWQRVFRLRLDDQQYFAGTSMLFNPDARQYWESFFVPLASWPNRAALRKTVASERKIVAVDSAGDRTAILFGNGEFQLLELADSEAAFPLAKYSRPKDFTRWEGIKILGNRVLIFGEDGIEIVGFARSGPRKLGVQERQAIGSIVAAVPYKKELLLASNRGLLITDLKAGNPRRLMRRPIKGLDRVGKSLVFTDGESVFISTFELLEEQRVLQQIELGYEFAPTRVVGLDRSAIVFGKKGALMIDLTNPASPKLGSRLTPQLVGKLHDASQVGGRVFLVGDRGLQLLDASASHVVEHVDVQPKQRIARMGRFLVTVGAEGMQIVDSVPLTFAVRAGSKAKGVAAPDASGR